MASIQIRDDLEDRYERLATDLEGFADGKELLAYVLDAAADELERTSHDTPPSGGANEASVEGRLRDLGYIE